jgi:RibD C-terminal domain
LLQGDAAESVARLKQEPGKDLVVLGSGQLLESLIRHDLIDEYVLLIHPLVLGSGGRLFADGTSFALLRLLDSVTTTTGVVIATYQRAEATPGQSRSDATGRQASPRWRPVAVSRHLPRGARARTVLSRGTSGTRPAARTDAA